MTGAVFIDRDDTINEGAPPGQYITEIKDFRFLPGALDALAFLAQNSERRIVIVTNQSPIGRGLATWEQVLGLHVWMEAEIERAGGRIDGVYVCPHRPDEGCGCRKPKPGLLQIAALGLDLSFDPSFPEPGLTFDLSRSVMIGDSDTDLQAAWAAGVTECYQVLTWQHQAFPVRGPYFVVEDLMAAAQALVRKEKLDEVYH